MQGQFLVTESVSANVIHVERAGTLRSILGRGGGGFSNSRFCTCRSNCECWYGHYMSMGYGKSIQDLKKIKGVSTSMGRKNLRILHK